MACRVRSTCENRRFSCLDQDPESFFRGQLDCDLPTVAVPLKPVRVNRLSPACRGGVTRVSLCGGDEEGTCREDGPRRKEILEVAVAMNPEEYANLERIEADHWYYSGKREFVRRWIDRLRQPGRDDVLLDCGAGTGLFAKEMEKACRVMVLDDHEDAIRMLRLRFEHEQVLSLAGDRIPLADCSLEYVTALDVLEHVPDDAAVVQGFHRVLKPGGLAVVTVPASMHLWSDWDESLHHHRRYQRSQLSELFPHPHWEVVHVNYTNCLIYPAVWAVRKWRRLFPRAEHVKRAEDSLPPPLVNRVLKRIFVGMAMWRMPLPFGVSLLLIARRGD